MNNFTVFDFLIASTIAVTVWVVVKRWWAYRQLNIKASKRLDQLRKLIDRKFDEIKQFPKLHKVAKELTNPLEEILKFKSVDTFFGDSADSPNGLRHMPDKQFESVLSGYEQEVDSLIRQAMVLSGEYSKPPLQVIFENVTTVYRSHKFWGAHEADLSANGLGVMSFITVHTAFFCLAAKQIIAKFGFNLSASEKAEFNTKIAAFTASELGEHGAKLFNEIESELNEKLKGDESSDKDGGLLASMIEVWGENFGDAYGRHDYLAEHLSQFFKEICLAALHDNSRKAA